ncbi:filamentous hemagglutinin N-terminal domain-containing protein [uncultured Helicobacter sp.]|uniref:filamentous hemagglutinin N-terminal domain-containing protein n=1 Tax=uncultured Helicobacter sp. TaxID=175537 RepID=UPI002605373A|nr:filamentous hemagglutinin N-terminal domain-containing protein [uncultured Helicobacter sp.]
MKSLHFLLQRSISLFLSLVLIFLPLSANPIVIDVNSSNTSLDKAKNGVDILNVATPDKNGISNNLYLEFNVKESGLIFNNSTSALTPSVLGEIITANPNLNTPASLILNQVTSTSPSTLLGMMEIAGEGASLLIANPNGITCQGCGFINTNNVTLATGLPQIMTNGYIEFNIQRGEINLKSLNALGSQALNLLAKNLSINSELYANTLRAILGSNQITLDEKGSLLLWQPIQREDDSSSLALDVAHLGRVYSNSIFLVANDEGVEAKIQGVMATHPSQKEGDGGFYIDINGNLKIATEQTQGETPALFSSSQMQISSNTLENEGYIMSLGDLSLQTQSLDNHSIISSNQTLSLQANDVKNTNALIQANNLLMQSERILNTQGFILAKENAVIVANEIENRAKVALNNEIVSRREESWTSGDFIKTQKRKYITHYEEKIKEYIPSMIYANMSLTINSNTLSNYDGQIYAENNLAIQANRFDNLLTKAKTRIQTITKRKCGFLYSKTCTSEDNSYGVKTLELPIVGDNLALAPSSGDFDVFSYYYPYIIEPTEISQEQIKDFISSDYFRDRFASLSYETQAEFLASLNSQERQDFISSLDAQDQSHLLRNFSNTHLQSFSSTLALQNLSSLLPINQRLNEELKQRYALQAQQDKDLPLSLPSPLTFSSSSLSGNIGGENIYIQAKVLNNEGSIFASRSIFAQTQEKLQNSGNISANDITLNSDGEISNIGGKLQATENLALSADSISMSSSIYTHQDYTQHSVFDPSLWGSKKAPIKTYSTLTTQSQNLLSQSSLGGKNISLNAKNTLSISATNLNATDNLMLNAKDISLSTQALVQKDFRDKASFSSSKTLLTNSLSANNILINASDSLTSSSSSIKADSLLAINAKNISLLADQEESYLHSSKSNGRRKSSTTTSISTSIVNTLAGENILINASESAFSVGSSIKAQENLSLNAKNFTSLSALSSYSTSNSSSKKGLFSSKSSSSSYSIESNTLAEFEGKNISLTTSSDMLLLGANLKAQEEVNIIADSFTLSSVSDKSSTSSSSSKNVLWGAIKKARGEETGRESSISSSITASNLSIQTTSGDLNLIGSEMSISSNASLSSSGSLNILNSFDFTSNSSYSYSRTLSGAFVDFKRKFRAGLEFKEKENSNQTSQRDVVASNLNVGSLNLVAKDTLNITASNINAENEIKAQASLVTISSASQVSQGKEKNREGTLRVGVEIGNAYVDAYYAGKDLYDAGARIESASHALRKAKQDYKEGKISKEALQDYETNLALLSASLVANTTNFASSISSVASSIASSYGTGFYAGGFAEYEGNITNTTFKNTTQVSSSLTASSISLSSLSSYTQSSSSLLAHNVEIQAKGEVKIEALANERTSNFESKDYGASMSFDTSGVSGGSVMGGYSKGGESSLEYVASSINASSLSITSGEKTTLSSSSLLSNDIEIKAKELEVISKSDTYSSTSKSFNANIGVSEGSGGVGGGFSSERESLSWVNSPSTLLASHSLNITLEDSLLLQGGVIGLGEEGEAMSISAKSIEATHISNSSSKESNGFNLSTSLGKSSLGVNLSGNTELSLLKLGSKKEGVSYATLGALNPNANITLSLQTQPSFSKDTILSNTESEKDLQTLGVNTNLSNTEQSTQEIQSRALNASLSINNHLFSSEGREKIKEDFLNLGNNLAQIGRGVRNNILTQSLINTAKDKDTNLFLEMYRYALIDDTLSSLFSQEELLNSLNGATNLDSTQFQEILNEVAKIASEENGFRATLKIYNNEEVTKGYAYSGVEGEWIGFNTLSNDITNPNAIINTIFHEASNKELHHSNDNYASNRGNSAESIFALKNYANTNTNTISTLEWNQRETTRETLRGNGVLKEGNEYNTRAWSGQGSGSGERDNAEIRRRPLSFDQKGKWEKGIDKMHHEHIFFEDEKGGNIGFTEDWSLKNISIKGKFFTETNPNVIAKYRETDGQHYDDAIMRKAVEDVKNSGSFKQYLPLIWDCQIFVKDVKKRYKELIRQQEAGK